MRSRQELTASSKYRISPSNARENLCLILLPLVSVHKKAAHHRVRTSTTYLGHVFSPGGGVDAHEVLGVLFRDLRRVPAIQDVADNQEAHTATRRRLLSMLSGRCHVVHHRNYELAAVEGKAGTMTLSFPFARSATQPLIGAEKENAKQGRSRKWHYGSGLWTK